MLNRYQELSGHRAKKGSDTYLRLRTLAKHISSIEFKLELIKQEVNRPYEELLSKYMAKQDRSFNDKKDYNSTHVRMV